MGTATVIIRSNPDRARAVSWVNKAPYGTRITFKASKRSIPQNDRFWAMLTEVAEQVKWHGMKLKPDDWKLIFMDALSGEMRIVPNIDGTGFVNLGRSSSKLSKDEMSDLIEVIFRFGAEHDVEFKEEDGG